MLWIGLTGGIGSGKSTVAAMIRDMGFPVLDADLVARLVLRPGTSGAREAIQAFGPEILTLAGEIDRKKLGQIVFEHRSKLELLESIVHPRVRGTVAREKDRLEKNGYKIAFYDVPLLFEKNMESDFSAIVLVTSSEENQILRVMKRNAFTRDEVSLRIANQMPLSQKALKSQYVIHNDGDMSSLRAATVDVVSKLLKSAEIKTRKNILETP